MQYSIICCGVPIRPVPHLYMANLQKLRNHHLFFMAILTSWCFLVDTSLISGSRNLQEKVLNSTKRAFPLESFYNLPRCDVAGIVAKFQSWDYRKSDEIADKLRALAQEMVDYSKFHRDLINSWSGNATVRAN